MIWFEEQGFDLENVRFDLDLIWNFVTWFKIIPNHQFFTWYNVIASDRPATTTMLSIDSIVLL